MQHTDYGVCSQNGTDGWYLDIDKTQLRWESYIKAGYYGVLNRFFDPTKVDPCVSGSPCTLKHTNST